MAAELDRNKRRFMKRRKHDAFYWDKIGGTPQLFTTPEIEIPDLDPERFADFERAVLKKVGRPRAEIEAEISERRAVVDALAQRSASIAPTAKEPERRLEAYVPGGVS